MQPQDNQDPNSGQLTSDELSATLAQLTHMQEQSMPKDAPQEGETAPQQGDSQEQAQNPEMDDLKTQIGDAFKQFEEKMTTMVDKKIGGLTDEIKSALNDEQSKE